MLASVDLIVRNSAPGFKKFDLSVAKEIIDELADAEKREAFKKDPQSYMISNLISEGQEVPDGFHVHWLDGNMLVPTEDDKDEVATRLVFQMSPGKDPILMESNGVVAKGGCTLCLLCLIILF
ncbi:hypothetical protein [Hoeflea alexandrii]|uniref:Uncharacterized protein n=1 Tax=Hoeflea alexandrii TaxID=288436 RepID=A0ABT1CML6_9HYPH|nr:hypothetical protein [Hoeflea alexandrii]MCO6407168.1 hypothetical protein [Hoeflea alexandrii]